MAARKQDPPAVEPAPDEHPLANIDRLIHEPARLLLMSLLYVVESADYVFLANQSGLTWGNLSSHMTKLEDAGYVAVEKTFIGKKPHTLAQLTADGRAAFNDYRQRMASVLNDLPD